MISFFRRNRHVNEPVKEPGVLQKMQVRICSYLQQRCNRIAKKWTYAILGVLMILYGLLSWQSIWQAFTSKQLPAVRISPIKPPASVGQVDTVQFNVRDGSEPMLQQRLDFFHQYFDSLRITDRNKYDSILVTRPGLFDTLKLLESNF